MYSGVDFKLFHFKKGTTQNQKINIKEQKLRRKQTYRGTKKRKRGSVIILTKNLGKKPSSGPYKIQIEWGPLISWKELHFRGRVLLQRRLVSGMPIDCLIDGTQKDRLSVK